MDIRTIITAVSNVSYTLKKRNFKHDHVENFQEAVIKQLQSLEEEYDWFPETIMSGGKHQDRADIYGGLKSNSHILLNGTKRPRIHEYKKNNNCKKNTYYLCEKTCDEDWIIEIDALRGDQVAAKFLSRVTLSGLSKKNIHYVALLYDFSKSNESLCLKYVSFAKTIMKRLNKHNTVDLIIVNQASDKVRYIRLDKPAYEVKFRSKKLGTDLNMSEVAQLVVRNYIDSKRQISYADLVNIFGKYISDEKGKSRYHDIAVSTSDNKKLFTHTQWRNNYGPQDNWLPFVNLCSELGYSITEYFKEE